MGGFPDRLLIRILIQFQIKLLYHHQQMIEYIGLNTFVFLPYLVSGKEVNLNGDSISRHLLLADNQVQILVHDRKAAKITFDVNTVKFCTPEMLDTIRKEVPLMADYQPADSCTPATKPRMLSLNTNINTAAEAPNPAKRVAGDLSIRIDTAMIAATKNSNTCNTCTKPFIG